LQSEKPENFRFKRIAGILEAQFLTHATPTGGRYGRGQKAL